ncbi:MAG TPA: D-2-hydroxyacid dehydrogenase [Candidatus Angelobacter sp.]|nr:D-2-hydroxyacid dehydrogenase [Candidatus Angelobacter sp.]
MKVLIVHYHTFELWHAPSWLRPRLQQAFPDIRFVQLPDDRKLAKEISDADVFIGWSLRPEFLSAAKKLRWIHSPAAAVNQLLSPELVESGIVVTNSTGVHGPVVAEHALAVILALAKRLPQAMRYQAKKTWSQDQLWNDRPRPREVDGATVVLVGMGGIGREFAPRAKALGMKVVAVRENPGKGASGADEVYGTDELDRVLPEADYVVLCAPLTAATAGIINRARLKKMKKDSYLINVSRGQLIDEAALLNTLQNRRIAGAALDVFSQEPLPRSSPFWRLDNLLITPHTAAVTERLWERHLRFISENLKRFIAGQPLLSQVDKARGY